MVQRVVSHTCSNTEIVSALGCADRLIGVDSDSDYPPETVARLPRLGRDLALDIGRVAALKPDLVLTSLTVPGHERVIAQLRQAGLPHLVVNPLSLEDVYASIGQIAEALGVADRGRRLVAGMRAEIRPVPAPVRRPGVAVQWWPKPGIVPGRRSWASNLIELAGGRNPWGEEDVNSLSVEPGDPRLPGVDIVVMSWCGVSQNKYRAEVVARQTGWSETPAVRAGRVRAISEAYLGRPGPRLAEGYRALRRLVDECGQVN